MAGKGRKSSDANLILDLLEDTLKRISACSAGRSEEQLCFSPGKKQWSAADILAHLRACAGISIYAMLAEDYPTLADVDPRRWASVKKTAAADFHSSYAIFAHERRELLQILRGLPPESWQRSADIGGRKHTGFSQARRMALHEPEHCAQMESLFQS